MKLSRIVGHAVWLLTALAALHLGLMSRGYSLVGNLLSADHLNILYMVFGVAGVTSLIMFVMQLSKCYSCDYCDNGH